MVRTIPVGRQGRFPKSAGQREGPTTFAVATNGRLLYGPLPSEGVVARVWPEKVVHWAPALMTKSHEHPT